MEYIKKEELIKGEIYKVQEGDFWMIGLITLIDNGNNDLYSKRGNATYISTNNELRKDSCWCYMGSNRNIINATSEEKHWLTSCITADKFITFEETMKTFNPEYVECIKEVIEPLPQFKVIESIETITKVENNEGNQFFVGDIVISSNGTIQTIESFGYNKAKTNIIAFTNKQSRLGNGIGIDKIEHYIEPKVVEPEFILPEKWCLKITNENLQFCRNLNNKELHYDKNYYYTVGGYYSPIKNKGCFGFYNIPNNYTEITFDQFKKYVLKEEVKEETLLEKAKRLYPVGTKYKCAFSDRQFTVILQNFSEISNIEIYGEHSKGCLLYKGKWAEIIEYSHGFKIGDKIASKYGNTVWKITKIEDNRLIFETSSLPKINSILAKNAIKVN